MNRKQFVESNGATCANWTWSWSFVNHQERFVIFGAWDTHINGENALILSGEWEHSEHGRKLPGYTQALEHVKLVEDEGYELKIFKMIYSDANKDEAGRGPAKMDGIEPILYNRSLRRVGNKWYANSDTSIPNLPEQIDEPEKCFEGASTRVCVNAYERNRKAREACLAHHGYHCSACGTSFEDVYGDIGREYIHVHHVRPLSEIGKEYVLNPIEDLIPVCPNCHAMIHRYRPALSVEDIKDKLQVKDRK